METKARDARIGPHGRPSRREPGEEAGRGDARINFRLRPELKSVIEEAATALGQSVTDFAIGTLVEHARSVIERSNVTTLSIRDRDRLIALLDDADARPNASLARAARRYRGQIGKAKR